MLLSNNTSYAYKVKELIPNYRINQYKNHRYFFNQSLLYDMSKTFIFLDRIFYKNCNLFFNYILIL